jgi:CxxC motif-containing protein (DUF1111 family)
MFLGLAGLLVAAGMTAHSVSLVSRPNHPPTINSLKVPCIPTQFGDPLPGLSSQEAVKFTIGQAQFRVVDGPADGLGPIFNAQSCNACHTQPVVDGVVTTGGASAITETRFGTRTNRGFDPLASEDGTLLHQSSIVVSAQEIVPQDATIIAHRKTTPLFGLGLVEAIPDAAILANVHNPPVDGVTGRAAVLTDPITVLLGGNTVGRFGWKCQRATILAFSGDAYQNEMGVSNRLFHFDLAPNGNQAALAQAEPFPYAPTGNQDPPENPAMPEGPNNKDDIDRFTDFMQLLAPPPTVPLTPQALVGQQLFHEVNCVACHKPAMQTGPSSVSTALAFKNVPLYSDLLLHRMGTLGDGIAQAAAQPDEIRTAPLWGLRGRSPFLHDGRASTILEAIRLHDGEARIIRDRFLALPEAGQDAIVAFLNSI